MLLSWSRALLLVFFFNRRTGRFGACRAFSFLHPRMIERLVLLEVGSCCETQVAVRTLQYFRHGHPPWLVPRQGRGAGCSCERGACRVCRPTVEHPSPRPLTPPGALPMDTSLHALEDMSGQIFTGLLPEDPAPALEAHVPMARFVGPGLLLSPVLQTPPGRRPRSDGSPEALHVHVMATESANRQLPMCDMRVTPGLPRVGSSQERGGRESFRQDQGER